MGRACPPTTGATAATPTPRANREIFVAVQIENAEAFAALDDILPIEGLDSVALGPWDLSASLGLLGDVEHPTVIEAVDSIIARTRAAGLFVGGRDGA